MKNHDRRRGLCFVMHPLPWTVCGGGSYVVSLLLLRRWALLVLMFRHAGFHLVAVDVRLC